MTADLRWMFTGMRGNKETGYTYTYRVYWDEQTWRDIDVRIKNWDESLLPVRRNLPGINLLFQAVVERSGYKVKQVSYSTFVNWKLGTFVTRDDLHL